MIETDIKRVIDQVSRDRGIDREILVKTMEEALKSAARKKFGVKVDIEVHYNEELGELEVFQFKDVVKEVTEPDLQISLEEGRKLDPGCEEGDSLGSKMDAKTFGRIAAQSAKQVIIQKMKDAERDVVYESFIDRKGQIINGIVQRMHRGEMVVNLGRTEGVLPSQEQVPRENYRRGERIRAYVVDVLRETRGPQIILSRTHPQFLLNLFKTEVPEIAEGIVEIKAAAREPGSRAKIAVFSNASDIDPVGACVGMKGSRVQSVVQELRGEKIDIIPWHADPAKFVCNALAPAEISRVVMDEINQSMEVIVPDEHLSVAIGKRGQNVRLASKLTGWGIDVKSESQYTLAMETGYQSLLELPGMGESTAELFREYGLYSVEELAKASIEDLIQIKGIGDTKANALLEAAREAVERMKEEQEAGEQEQKQASEPAEPLEEAETQAVGVASEDAADVPGEDAAQESKAAAEVAEASEQRAQPVEEEPEEPSEMSGLEDHD